MPARLNFMAASRDVFKAMQDMQAHVSNSGLEPGLLHLVSMLVSRINGCAYCIDMHGKDLRAAGESDLRIDLVSVWEEVDCYSERERAAFAWAESHNIIERLLQALFDLATFSPRGVQLHRSL